jgi:hypothetical protein
VGLVGVGGGLKAQGSGRLSAQISQHVPTRVCVRVSMGGVVCARGSVKLHAYLV